MKKLYYAKIVQDVVFCEDNVSLQDSKDRLTKIARHYLDEQEQVMCRRSCDGIEIKEIISLDEVPEEWISAIYWGSNAADYRVSDYFHNKEKEDFEKAKETYLRLKDKYEKV